jgi:hypothetical protein
LDASYQKQVEQKKYDENRDQVMREFGLTILQENAVLLFGQSSIKLVPVECQSPGHFEWPGD